MCPRWDKHTRVTIIRILITCTHINLQLIKINAFACALVIYLETDNESYRRIYIFCFTTSYVIVVTVNNESRAECKKGDRSPHVSLALNLATSDTSLPDDASVQLPILSLRLSSTVVRSCTYTLASVSQLHDTDVKRADALIYTQTATVTLV